MLIGIAIPAFRAASFIRLTLDSIVRQTHQDWFAVVANDGADDDGTAEVVREIGDDRIRYVGGGPRRGQPGNFNRAILEVLRQDPDVVRLFCADDIMYAHTLADVCRVLTKYPRVGLVSAHFDGIDAAGRTLFYASMDDRPELVMDGRDYLLRGVAVGNTIGGPSSVALRREAIGSAGLFDTQLDYAGDSELWNRVAAHWDIAWIGRRAGYQYRFHESSVTARDCHTEGKFSDPIQVVRRVASAAPLLGFRWWAYQYTIGRLHALNLQVIAGLARRGRWDGVAAGLRASMKEGLPMYAPFWIPRLPYQAAQALRGESPSRRLILRRLHEALQPARIPTANRRDGHEGRHDK